MLHRILLLAFLSLTAICSAKELDPFAGPKPVVVLLQENPWATVMGAETPRIAVYENGEVIYSRGTGENQVYFHAEMSFSALSDVMDHLKPVIDLKDLKPMYSLPDGTNQGAVLFYLNVDGKEAVTSVYGLGLQDDDDTAKRRTIGRVPDELRELYRYLTTVDFTETRPWSSTYVEAMLWPVEEAPDGVLPWPSSWPDLKSDRAIQRKSGYSIFLDSAMRNDLKKFLALEKKNGAVEINGQNWTVASRPVFPSEPVWRKAFSKIEENQ